MKLKNRDKHSDAISDLVEKVKKRDSNSAGKKPSATIYCTDCQAEIQQKDAAGCSYPTCITGYELYPAIKQEEGAGTISIKKARSLCFSCALHDHRHFNCKNILPFDDYASEELVMETLDKVMSLDTEMKELFNSLLGNHPAGVFFEKV